MRVTLTLLRELNKRIKGLTWEVLNDDCLQVKSEDQ